MSGADLTGSHLSGANQSNANLTGTVLTFANLRDAVMSNLNNTNLSGVDLSGVKNLTQDQLNGACGKADTKPPRGLTLKAMRELCDSGPVPRSRR